MLHKFGFVSSNRLDCRVPRSTPKESPAGGHDTHRARSCGRSRTCGRFIPQAQNAPGMVSKSLNHPASSLAPVAQRKSPAGQAGLRLVSAIVVWPNAAALGLGTCAADRAGLIIVSLPGVSQRFLGIRVK
jgi:hypothetical protein